jgi:hypothetical protein
MILSPLFPVRNKTSSHNLRVYTALADQSERHDPICGLSNDVKGEYEIRPCVISVIGYIVHCQLYIDLLSL